MDDRALRVAIIVIGHLMWLSTAALRALRGHREHQVVQRAGWPIESYPVLVWIPLVLAISFSTSSLDIADGLRLAGVALALSGALFAAWAMWSLGRGYGVRTDLFAGHRLKTDGPFGVVRHPMYLGILVYHVGASIALESLTLLGLTALPVLPYTAARIVAEERVLRAGSGDEYERYRARVPMLLPLPR